MVSKKDGDPSRRKSRRLAGLYPEQNPSSSSSCAHPTDPVTSPAVPRPKTTGALVLCQGRDMARRSMRVASRSRLGRRRRMQSARPSTVAASTVSSSPGQASGTSVSRESESDGTVDQEQNTPSTSGSGSSEFIADARNLAEAHGQSSRWARERVRVCARRRRSLGDREVTVARSVADGTATSTESEISTEEVDLGEGSSRGPGLGGRARSAGGISGCVIRGGAEGGGASRRVRAGSRGAGSVAGESFCVCAQQSQSRDLQCTCGEDDPASRLEWKWDGMNKSSACEVSTDGRDASFHVNYSSGTAVARGTELMTDRQYFWEIKMTTPVYGTDMMVGVGSANMDLDANRYMFCSALGRDKNSCGLSYYGKVHHGGRVVADVAAARFGQGSIIGLHLDTWQGCLSFYKNRKPLGVVCRGLRGQTLYPMISSTAARTGMRLIKACSYETSLEFLCCSVLRQTIPSHLDVTRALRLPPGLHDFLANNLSWLLCSNELASARGVCTGAAEGVGSAEGEGEGTSRQTYWSIAEPPRLTSIADDSEFERPVKRARLGSMGLASEHGGGNEEEDGEMDREGEVEEGRGEEGESGSGTQ